MLKGGAANPAGLIAGNNLSDVGNPVTALTNIGGLKGGCLQALAQTSAFSLVLPIKGIILGVVIKNNNANAITGGLKFGSTNGGVDVLAALAVAANFIGHAFDAALLKRFFSTSATQTIFIDAVVSWNSANVDVSIPYVIIP